MTLPSVKQPYLVESRSFRTGDLDELERILQQMYGEVAQNVNNRTIGLHDKIQVTTGEKWFDNIAADDPGPLERRQSYRRVFTLDAIGTSAAGTVNHGIVGITAITRLWATAVRSDGAFIPIPYVSTGGANPVGILATNTQIIINNGSATLSLSNVIIVVEYLLN